MLFCIRTFWRSQIPIYSTLLLYSGNWLFSKSLFPNKGVFSLSFCFGIEHQIGRINRLKPRGLIIHRISEARICDVTSVGHLGTPLCTVKGPELRRHTNRPQPPSPGGLILSASRSIYRFGQSILPLSSSRGTTVGRRKN
jgi:hypothetical protein